MKLGDFDFDLPKELIAQSPTQERDSANLLARSREGYKISKFRDIVNYLHEGDVLVFNNSRVINAELKLAKNGANINVNLNRPIGNDNWLGFARPSKKLSIGDEFAFGAHKILIQNKMDFGEVELKFILHECSIFEFLDQYGSLPLPPYIKRSETGATKEDYKRYQTVYSKDLGSVAAPTAGLHFTDELIRELQQKNIKTEFITLHVGGGTFLPVKTEEIALHKMHSEFYTINQQTADNINQAKADGKKVIAVGTTSLRAMEACAGKYSGNLSGSIDSTEIFITPGYEFKIVDALITNFHLPKSTLFILICAFMGYENAHKMYQYAILNKMRFFSYGDSTFIEKI